MEYNRCRLCLEDTDKFINIFEDSFPEMILTLTGIKIEPDDGLPKISCYQCNQDVKYAMLTRYQIINAHQSLMNELNNKYNEDKLVDKVLVDSNVDNHTSDIRDTLTKVDSTENDQSSREEKSSRDNFDKHSSDNSDFECREDAFSEGDQSETIPDNKLPRQKTGRRNLNKQIKFRKKTSKRYLNEDKTESKTNNSLTVKVKYDIKPEHQEFLKTLGRKDRVPCPDCGRVMYGMNMKNHLITHTYEPVVCSVCGKTSKNAQALQDHINYYHKTTPDRFMCDKCGKGYRVRFMLLKHEKKEHGSGEKDHECSICGKKFFEKLHLKNHINITHKKIKAYKCEHCGKDFGRRTQFVTHQLVHTKENRYHCQICGKGFKIKQTMQTHLKGVHGIEEEKTIFCKICHKGFSSSQGLRAHVNSRVHGLEKCELCSEFITVEYKSVHLKDVHGIVE